jgi:hypothetical protein
MSNIALTILLYQRGGLFITLTGITVAESLFLLRIEKYEGGFHQVSIK